MLYSVSYLGRRECVGLTEYHQVLRSETKEVTRQVSLEFYRKFKIRCLVTKI